MGRLERVYKEKTSKPIYNLDLIKAYLRKLRNDKKSVATQRTDCTSLISFSRFFDKDIREMDVEDIYNYLDYLDDYEYFRGGKKKKLTGASIYTFKISLKKFLNFANRPDLASLIVCKNPTSRKLPEDLLTKAEVEKMLKATLTPRDAAILTVLYESGARKGELASVKLKNIVFDENGAVVTLPEGKTGARRIRLVFSASYLRNWVIDHHPLKEDPDAPLFVSLREPYPRLSNSGLFNQLQRLANRAGVKKRVNPHSFRHARATELAKALSDQQLKSYMGWTAGSSMAQIYVHLSGKDLDDAILKMNGIEIKADNTNTLIVGRCPRCRELNPDKASYCLKCGMPLKDQSINQLENETDTFESEFAQLIAKYPGLIENLSKYKKNE